MKKIKLIIVLLLICSVSIAQKFNKVYKSTLLHYENNDWVEVMKKYPQDMYIVFDGKDIRINNTDESHYITIGEYKKNEYKTHTCYTWECMDRKGISCNFMMKSFEDGSWIFCFVYPREHKMFEYQIEKE